MSPTLLVLGGGVFVTPVLHWAREAGLVPVLVDPDPRAPARRAAHEFHILPSDDVAAHVALLRRLQRDALQHQSTCAGIWAAEAWALPLLAPLAEAAPELLPSRRTLERLLVPEQARAFLLEQGFPLASMAAHEPMLDLFGFFRDGAFVPGGVAARSPTARGETLSAQPSGLPSAREHAAYVLAERAARRLGLERGPLQATLSDGPDGLALVTLAPGFTDLLGAVHVARLAYAKSPLQAWLAHLADAGGPFDELALVPRACAGWLALSAERAGVFAGVDGLARARAVPGLVDSWIEEPGRKLASPEIETRPLGYLWAEGCDRTELEQRLLQARAALTVCVAQRQQVA